MNESVVFLPGEENKTFEASLKDDNDLEYKESFTVSDNAHVSENNRLAEVIIIDNESESISNMVSCRISYDFLTLY